VTKHDERYIKRAEHRAVVAEMVRGALVIVALWFGSLFGALLAMVTR
jgi:hypothetical protein